MIEAYLGVSHCRPFPGVWKGIHGGPETRSSDGVGVQPLYLIFVACVYFTLLDVVGFCSDARERESLTRG